MRILVLSNLFPSAWDPLRASFNRQQFDRLGARHEVEVLVPVDFRQHRRPPAGAPPALAHARAGTFTFWYPPRIGRSLHALAWCASLWSQRRRWLRQGGFDLLLASWAFPDAVGTAWLARRLGLPYAVKVHGSDLNVLAGYRLRRWQIARSLRGAGAVLAVSRALAGRAVELGAAPAGVHVLYNGVDGALFRPGDRAAARRALGLPVEGRLLLFVGNLKPEKGCIDALAALPTVRDRHPGTRIAFVGEGPARARLQASAAGSGLADAVLLAGARGHAELPAWMQAADLLVLPSHNEGVPNVVLEAMSCGLPVVATAVGGIPEVLPPLAGLLVPPRDPAALAATLDQALARPWNGAAIRGHAAGFDWDDNIARLDAILTGVVQAHRARSPE
ncbi:MAG: glycosyltransferase family 4 protein [Pseudoxanthomonas sp.]|nr:glycosyltransferase family 4 protein [Pseudoxanthomonas sp.]